jgi:hypothetical protein
MDKVVLGIRGQRVAQTRALCPIAQGVAVSREIQLSVSATFIAPGFAVVGLISGLICVLKAESVRAVVDRHDPAASAFFGGAERHRRFVQFGGWALIALAASVSLLSFVAEG